MFRSLFTQADSEEKPDEILDHDEATLIAAESKIIQQIVDEEVTKRHHADTDNNEALTPSHDEASISDTTLSNNTSTNDQPPATPTDSNNLTDAPAPAMLIPQQDADTSYTKIQAYLYTYSKNAFNNALLFHQQVETVTAALTSISTNLINKEADRFGKAFHEFVDALKNDEINEVYFYSKPLSFLNDLGYLPSWAEKDPDKPNRFRKKR